MRTYMQVLDGNKSCPYGHDEEETDMSSLINERVSQA